MIKRGYTLFLPLLLHVFNILEQCSRLPCLTIDNRISVATNDCYTRTSIGSKLPDANVVTRAEVESLTECKEECSKNGNTCNAFTYGVGSNGNRTCGITTRIPPIEHLEIHPDYDVYIKQRQGSAWCNVDHLYRDFTFRDKSRDSLNTERPNKKGLVTNVPNSFSKPVSMPAILRGKNDTVRYGLIGTYDLFVNHDGRFLSGDDERSRVLDILTNRNQGPASSSSFVTICHRKLQAGKKMVDLHVQRIVPCENVQDCHWACDYEKTFICYGYNYGHGANGSQDMCELISTPYYHANINRDFLTDSRYDYYQRDRNCLSSMRADDILHWTNRAKVYQQNRPDRPNRPNPITLSNQEDHQFSWRKFPGRGAEYVHEIDKQPPDEISRDFASHRYSAEAWNNNWRNSESHYSDIVNNNVNSLYDPRINYNERHSNNIKPPASSKSEFDDRLLSHQLFNSHEAEHFNGKYYNYSSAFAYNNDNYVPVRKEFFSEEQEHSPETSKCSLRLTAGSKISRNILRKSCLAHDFKQCEQYCFNELTFRCESFAYRYDVLTTNPTDNCLLSDFSYQDFNFYTDIEPDRDYDSYITSQDSNICRSKEQTTNRYPSEECFSRVKSGFGIPTDVTKKSVLVDDLGECQYACIMSQEFICRSFAFKYAQTTKHRDPVQQRTTPNCFLTDCPSEQINPINMLDMDGAELYERNSFSYDCEAYPLPLSITDITVSNDKKSASADAPDICYSQHHRPCKLLPHAIISSTRAITKSECCRKCWTMRNIPSTPCMSFNYMIITDDTRNNCLLSNIPARDLRPHLDYAYDDQHTLYTFKDLDPYCSLTANPLNSPNIAASVSKEHDQLSFSPTLPQRNSQNLFGDRIRSHGAILDSLYRTRSKFRLENQEDNYEHNRETGNFDVGPQLVSDAFHHVLADNRYPKEHSIFERYTVNGYPCKNGSLCQRNEIAGFWSCETEENEYDSWDYCCEPNHRCGFSQGYHYPWCYVGLSNEQWRPCSETYYPYYTPKDHRSFHSQQSQLPATHLARHWPVMYLHETLPPNCTANSDNGVDNLSNRY